ncbi:MAG: leucyl aminopeptidase family protein [Sphingorhabdus sp.]
MTDYSNYIQPDNGQDAISITLVDKDGFEAWLSAQPQAVRSAAKGQGFDGSTNSLAILPANGEGDYSVVAGVADADDPGHWSLAHAAEQLPAGTYRLDSKSAGSAIFGWMLGHYSFDDYRTDAETKSARILLVQEPGRIENAALQAKGTALVRDLVNCPAADMGPSALEAEVRRIAGEHGGDVEVTSGDKLEQGYPLIHAVGRAAAREFSPRLIELTWGDERHPRIALVGKGVAFDSGGLDIKGAAGMRLMKKDMGGAAHVLALAEMVMAARLPVRLHMLVPAVENAISGNALRPGDVVKSRAGITVEIDNTDAEGRLVLADSITKALESKPQLMIDFATLTGAARVALGPDLPPVFANDDELAEKILVAGNAAEDPLWHMPLWQPYDDMLASDIADTANSGGRFAGAVTAALFLQKFTGDDVSWAHIDTFAWRPASKSGRPKGGEALGLRAVFGYLAQEFPAR